MVNRVLPPLHVDYELFGSKGSYFSLIARCCPLAYLVNAISYVRLPSYDRSNKVKILEDRSVLLMASSVSGITSTITAIILKVLGFNSPFVDANLYFGLLITSLCVKALRSSETELTIAQCNQIMDYDHQRRMEQLKIKQQKDLEDLRGHMEQLQIKQMEQRQIQQQKDLEDLRASLEKVKKAERDPAI